eukprot:633345-Amphidinium_carterae.2
MESMVMDIMRALRFARCVVVLCWAYWHLMFSRMCQLEKFLPASAAFLCSTAVFSCPSLDVRKKVMDICLGCAGER